MITDFIYFKSERGWLERKKWWLDVAIGIEWVTELASKATPFFCWFG